MPANNPDPDALLWGVRNIALGANLIDKDGKPQVGKAYHLLQKGKLPADKIGRSYVSTARRLRSIASGEQPREPDKA